MAGEFPAPDEAFQKKKKTVIIIGTILIILLGGTLIVGQVGGLFGAATPSPSVVAVITTLPPTATPTDTSLPLATSTPRPTDTAQPPTDTPQPPTPTLPPSPTPEPPTSTPSPSPTSQPPTPTPTATPTPYRVPIIENPADGSELPGEGLTIDGSAESGTTVKVYEGDTLLGETPVSEGGNWSLVLLEKLAAGDHTVVAVDVSTDATSAAVTFTLIEALLPITGSEGIPKAR